MHIDELYHHGVKGMKWGVRKQYGSDGSAKTAAKLRALTDATKNNGPYYTRKQYKKINKLYNDYNKSATKDLKKTVKTNNMKTAKSIAAGRAYMRVMMNQEFQRRVITDAAVKAHVQVGKDFTWKALRDDSLGGVKITINNKHSESYMYFPEGDKMIKNFSI